jgi:hypothetical protein
MTMEKTLYLSPPISHDDHALLVSIRPGIHRRVIEGGFSAEDMRRLLVHLRQRPHLMASVLDILLEEAEVFPSLAGVFNLRWE